MYVLRLGERQLYVGSTAKPLRERVAEHKVKARRRGAVTLLRYRGCATRAEAERVERKTASALRARGWEVEQS